MSDTEPELGLGLVVEIDERSVVLAFTAADERRRYAIKTAPLRRVRFGPGDTIRTAAGEALTVEAVEERDGLLVYRSGRRAVAEAALSDRVALSGPRERLLTGRVDPPDRFDLRLAALRTLHRVRCSPVRGFVGPRVELLPHQFYIATAVTGRHAPRVLLADETGLGKTIEACLILNRLLLTGRAARALVLVPDALVHQWLVELRRRFNLPFAIFDADRCRAIAESDPDANPFLTEQLVLAGIDLLTDDPTRTGAAASAGWDVVVVDEAHHLAWTRAGASPAYEAVAAVTASSEGLLLLTATPERLGEEGHFARLRLLDPDRYDDFARWQREADGYRAIAHLGRRVLERDEDGAALAPDELARLAAALGTSVAAIAARAADDRARRQMLDALIDRHGPGRVMFRNTRAAMPAFPTRQVALHRLPPTPGAAPGDPALDRDPRLAFLAGLLATPEPAKLFVVCRDAAAAQAIKTALEQRLRVGIALFHEDMTLLQRDRSAAWFVASDGARVLIASEIGSEGRNFQHAQVMVMFDLPLDPDLVEQRIGRLDRIGQRGTVHIHVPFVAGSGQEVLARWHHEGVDAFARPTLTALPLLEQFGPRVRDLAARADAPAAATAARGPDTAAVALERLIAETATAARALAARVAEGRDRLLELASLRRDVAAALIERVAELDGDAALEELCLRILEHVHVYAEELGPRVYLLNPDGVRGEDMPALGPGETAVTFDRETALVREDLVFLTADHPLVNDAVELLLASEAGNAAFALADGAGPPHLRLEMVFVLEAVAPRRLHVDRFLPPTPVHVATDQASVEQTPLAPDERALAPGRGTWIAEHRDALAPLLTRMTAACTAFAETRAETLRAAAATEVRARLDEELARLRALARVNDHVRPEEIAALVRQRAALVEHIATARLRPDASRLVWHGPHRDGVPVRAA